MPIVECPHCFTRVSPKADGTCPACQENVHDTSGVDLSRASLSVSMSDRLPGLCYDCGQNTDRQVYVEARRVEDSDGPSPVLGVILSVVSFLLLPITLIWLGSRQQVEVSVHLPQCETCGQTVGRPKPEFVNFQRDSMTFIVDRRFRDEVVKLRERRDR